MKTKRNPQDATLRNIRALKKRVELLEEAVHGLVVLEMDRMKREASPSMRAILPSVTLKLPSEGRKIKAKR